MEFLGTQMLWSFVVVTMLLMVYVWRRTTRKHQNTSKVTKGVKIPDNRAGIPESNGRNKSGMKKRRVTISRYRYDGNGQKYKTRKQVNVYGMDRADLNFEQYRKEWLYRRGLL